MPVKKQTVKDAYVEEFPPCKFAGDEADEFCAVCNGLSMQVDGKDWPCTECGSYEAAPPPVEEVKKPVTAKKAPITANIPPIAAVEAEEADEPVLSPMNATAVSIKAESGMSLELKDRTGALRWYKFMYSEERLLNEGADVEEERKKLWEAVNNEVDMQGEEIRNFLKA